MDGVTLIDVEAYAVDIRGLRIGDPDLHNILEINGVKICLKLELL